MQPFSRFLLLLLFGFFISTGCGGGGGSSSSSSDEDSTESTPSATVTADAGEDQQVSLSETVTVDASASKDSSGRPLAFDWYFSSVPDGSIMEKGKLSSPTSDRSSFTPDIRGAYTLEVKVSVSGSQDSATDQVTVTVFGTSGGSTPANPPSLPPSSPGTTPEEDDDEFSDQYSQYSSSVLETTVSGEVRSIFRTSDLGLAAIAEDSASSGKAEFVKISRDGSLDWSKSFGSGTNDTPLVIKETSPDHFMVFGHGESPDLDYQSIFMISLSADTTGDDLTPVYFDFGGNARLNNVRTTSDDRYLVAATLGGTKMLFAKIDESQILEEWPIDSHEGLGIDALETSNGDVIFLGETTDSKIFLAGMKADGTASLEPQILGGDGMNLPHSVWETDSGYLIAGSTDSLSADNTDPDFDIFLIETGPDGDPLENDPVFPGKILGKAGTHEFITAMTAHPNSKFSIIGSAEWGVDNFDIYLAGIDLSTDSLVVEWERYFGMAKDDFGLYVMGTANGGLNIGGSADGNIEHFVSPSDFSFRGSLWLAQTTATGNIAPSSIQIPDRKLPADTDVMINLSIFFTDIGKDALIFSAEGLPDGLTFDSSGVLSGTTPNVAAEKDYTVTITASDEGNDFNETGLTTKETFTLTIAPE